MSRPGRSRQIKIGQSARSKASNGEHNGAGPAAASLMSNPIATLKMTLGGGNASASKNASAISNNNNSNNIVVDESCQCQQFLNPFPGPG